MKRWSAIINTVIGTLVGGGLYGIPSRGLASYVMEELPSQFSMRSGSMTVRTLGGACLGFTSIRDGSPCVATYLALQKKPQFFGTALIGNGYEALKTTNDILYKPLSREDLEKLFTEKSNLEASGSMHLTFLAKGFEAQFTPFEASLNALIRNSTYPIVGIHAVNQRTLKLGWGKELWPNILVGSYARIFQRRFVHQEFQMFQALTNSGAIMKPEEQNGISWEPSLTWWFENPINFRWTLAAENISLVSKQFEELNSRPNWMTGIGTSTGLGFGVLELGLDLRLPQEESVEWKDFQVGANYRLGALQFITGLNEQTLSGGVRFALRNIDLGVSYFTTRWPSGAKDNYQQTLMTQLGLGF